MCTINIFDGYFDFLSNFYTSPIEIGGINYPTVEHYFQAMKTTDIADRMLIAQAATPGKAKRMGRGVTLRADWEDIKNEVMYTGLKAKFKDPELRERLLSTGTATLIEGTTWHDKCWGVCYCDQCQGQGENRLGRLLMKLRDEIKNEKGA